MLIKLYKISHITTGHGKSTKVESTNIDPLWINPTHIAKLERERVHNTDIFLATRVTWGVGNTSGHVQVTESPEQINALINAAIRGARQ